MNERSIVIVGYDGCQTLDVTGPAEVFAGAARMRPGSYTVTVASELGGVVRGTSGVGLTTVPMPRRGAIDTLIVAGGFAAPDLASDDRVVGSVRSVARRARRVTSVCTGAYLLAAAGLLAGRRVTTHWSAASDLAQRYPDVTVDPDPIFVRDGAIWTSAGVTAGMDLALALVADDLGHDVAHELARWLVMFVRRPGGQSQFSQSLRPPRAQRPFLRDLQDWLPDQLASELSVATMSRRANVSPRTLARAFRAELGTTPAAHITALRMERAKQLLTATDVPVTTVAGECGFSAPETFHRAFRRAVGTSPERYRQHFSPPSEA